MLSQEVSYSSALPPSTQEGAERRCQNRFEVKTEVQLALGRGTRQIIVRNQNLGWGGASLLLPETGLDIGESVSLEFPWAQGRSFSAYADVVWKERIEGRRSLVGVRFSKLLLAHEERLARLLTLLAEPGQTDRRDLLLAERVEIEFIDREDMEATLEEVRTGRLELTSFRPYELDQSVQLVVSRVGSTLGLHLRARVVQRRPLSLGGEEVSPRLFMIRLVLEHPLFDLERSVERMLRVLRGDTVPQRIAS